MLYSEIASILGIIRDGAAILVVKNVIKFSLGALGIAALGLAAIFVIDYLKQRENPELASVQKELEDIKKQMEDDPYGGSTPEETLQLFITALKDGNTDLAAKYFVAEEQTQWKADLAKMKEKGLLDEMIRDLGREKFKYSISENMIGFDVADENKEAILSIVIVYAKNGRWKIQDL